MEDPIFNLALMGYGYATAPVRSFNKSIIPSNPALGESAGTIADIKALNPNIKQLRDPQTNKVLYQLEKEDYSFGNDWETIAPKDFKDYGTHYIDPLKGGSTDIQSFNKKLNDLRMSATHSKYPLEINAMNKGQLPVSKGLAKDLIGSQRYKEAPRFPGSEAREIMPVDAMDLYRRYYIPNKQGGKVTWQIID